MMTPVFSFDNIYRQYLKCRKNKRNTINALMFEYDLEENIVKLHEGLETQTYSPSRSVCFALKQPKLREIFAADFRDRVVHHILVNYLERFWEPVFIYDSYACRRGKGTQRAVKWLQSFVRKVSLNGSRRAYFMQLDIRGFFLHINKMDGVNLKRMYETPATISTLKGQYRFFSGRYPGSILFFQVGKFYEFYDRQAEVVIKALGITRMKATRSFRVRCGFPVGLKERYLKEIIRLRLPVHIVNEEDGWLCGIRNRRVAESWLPG